MSHHWAAFREENWTGRIERVCWAAPLKLGEAWREVGWAPVEQVGLEARARTGHPSRA